MQIGNIEGSNFTFLGNGEDVADLRVVRDVDAGTITSAWLPTPAEVAAIQRGEPVYLTIFGDGHPPVYVGVKGVSS